MAIPSPAMIGVMWGQLSVQAFFVFFRFWIRKSKLKSRMAAPDYLIFLSLFWTIIGICLMTLLTLLDMKAEASADNPLEKLLPYIALSKQDMARYMKYTVGITVCYYSGVWSVKASFLAMYFALGEKINKGMRKVLLIAAIFTGAAWVTVIIINLMWCRPLSRTWEVVVPTDPQYCMFLDLPVLVIHLSFNISTDLFLLIFSLILLRSVHMQRREAAGFAFVILIGGISIIGAIARVAVILPYWDDYIQRYEWKQKAAIWSMVEQSAAIVACCLPSFRLFLRNRRANNPFASSRDEEGEFVNPAFVKKNRLEKKGKRNIVAAMEVEEGERTPWDIPGIALAPYAGSVDGKSDDSDVGRHMSILGSMERISSVAPSLGNEPWPRTAWDIPGIETESDTSAKSVGKAR